MEELIMRIMATAFALTLAAAVPAYAMDEALTEEQIEGVQTTIRGMDCTVEDTDIEMENGGYEADDVICKNDKKFDVYLDKDFKVIKKVKED
jgi:hypothetical protein